MQELSNSRGLRLPHRAQRNVQWLRVRQLLTILLYCHSHHANHTSGHTTRTAPWGVGAHTMLTDTGGEAGDDVGNIYCT